MYIKGDKRQANAKMHPCLNNDPLIKQLYDLVQSDKRTMGAIAKRAGVSKNAMTHWFLRGNPRMVLLQSVLQALGYELQIVRKQ